MYSNNALYTALITVLASSSNSLNKHPSWRSFPEEFKFGVGSSAYQIEGGWNAAGKGENIWDRVFHTKLIKNENGDVSCDSYHQYERDIDMIKRLNVSFYRFSLSWSRLFPNGSINTRNPDGFRYYNALIDGLIHQGIKPVVTLFHWDHPQSLENIGGWTNPNIQDYFEDYANECFKEFGDRVKTWMTINEPNVFCLYVYGMLAFFSNVNPDFFVYQCGHNVLLAHARAYHLYNNRYRVLQGGKIGITMVAGWYEPATESIQDVMATKRSLEFELGWFAHPIFSMDGDYPKIMKNHMELKSRSSAYPNSILPVFTIDELKFIKGTSDFFGLNHYSSSMVKDNSNLYDGTLNRTNFTYHNETDAFTFNNDSWSENGLNGLSVNPEGFYKILIHIQSTYGNPEIRVYENGFPTKDILDDDDRIKYMNQYLNAMMDAMEDGVRISMYSFWTLMDALEWLNGFKHKFGLYAVDFEDPQRKRTPKKSTKFFKELASRKMLRQVSSLDIIERKSKEAVL